MTIEAASEALAADAEAIERRFSGLRRLYGDAGYARLRSASVAVVGLGGVGSWAAEALARSGVGSITLIDFDQVSESNINRQVQALGATVGQSKVHALQRRIADIHPHCRVNAIEAFVESDAWPDLLVERLDALIDACDQVRAKALQAAWALRQRVPFVTVGAAGGKRMPQAVEVDDLASVTHDPLLAALRQQMRQRHGAPRHGAMGIGCVYSREPVLRPSDACDLDGTLNCHGYGSSVAVTGTFGFVAASETIRRLLVQPRLESSAEACI